MESRYPFVNAFPPEISAIVRKIEDVIGFHQYSYTERIHYFEIVDGDRRLQLPIRVYFEELPQEKYKQLNSIEQAIFNCIMTRHTDGHLREKALREIIETGYPWIIPYVFQLIGEYVGNIHQVILEKYKNIDAEQLATFLKSNPAFYETTQRRTLSYWDAYYAFKSKYPDKRKWPAIRALFEIEAYTHVPLSKRIFKKR